ncbi:fimbrillin family protein [Bacteroides acidifaciens]|nr:fimbrillin family protein [Bacteroides acidifaciens]
MGNAKASDSGASDWYRFLTPFFFIYVQQPDRQIRPLRGIGGQQTPFFGHMKNKILAISLLMATFAGCSEEEKPTNPNFPADGVIRIDASVDTPSTRSFNESGNLMEFGINVDNPKSEAHCYRNVRMSRAAIGAEWISDTQMLWQNNTQAVTVLAYAPYVEGDLYDSSANVPVRVESDQSTEDAGKQSDFLLSKQQINPATDLVDGKIRLSLSHAMSQLKVVVTLGADMNAPSIPAQNPLSDLKVNGTVIAGTCNFAASTPKVTASAIGTGTVIARFTNYVPAATQSQNGVSTYECIIIPQTISPNTLSVTFRINDVDYSWTSPDAITFENGVRYTLNLTANKGEIVVKTSVSSSPWDTSTEEDTPIHVTI